MSLFKKFFGGRKGPLVNAAPVTRVEALTFVAERWSEWDDTNTPPQGWQWLKDSVLPEGRCLVSFNRGALEKISRCEWRKVRRRREKAAFKATQSAANQPGA